MFHFKQCGIPILPNLQGIRVAVCVCCNRRQKLHKKTKDYDQDSGLTLPLLHGKLGHISTAKPIMKL